MENVRYILSRFTVPRFTIPNFTVLRFTIPDFTILRFTIPDFTVPRFTIPDFTVPDFSPFRILPFRHSALCCSVFRCSSFYYTYHYGSHFAHLFIKPGFQNWNQGFRTETRVSRRETRVLGRETLVLATLNPSFRLNYWNSGLS